MMITFAKETSGIDCDECTFVDEFIARVLKNWRGDEDQSTAADFRTLMDARKVFSIYNQIKARGGITSVYPNRQQPSVTEVIVEFAKKFQGWPNWRALEEDEVHVLGFLEQIWIRWYDDATDTEESDMETEMEFKYMASDDERVKEANLMVGSLEVEYHDSLCLNRTQGLWPR